MEVRGHVSHDSPSISLPPVLCTPFLSDSCHGATSIGVQNKPGDSHGHVCSALAVQSEDDVVPTTPAVATVSRIPKVVRRLFDVTPQFPVQSRSGQIAPPPSDPIGDREHRSFKRCSADAHLTAAQRSVIDELLGKRPRFVAGKGPGQGLLPSQTTPHSSSVACANDRSNKSEVHVD